MVLVSQLDSSRQKQTGDILAAFFFLISSYSFSKLSKIYSFDSFTWKLAIMRFDLTAAGSLVFFSEGEKDFYC
jgi:hypothetical protein